jgi:hypothetical protein
MKIYHQSIKLFLIFQKYSIIFFSPQTSTPLLKRNSSNKKPFTIEPKTPSPRLIRRSDIHLNEELNKITSARSAIKRKHSTNSISPTSTTSSIIIKKRARNESPLKKQHSKNKRKESQTEDDPSDDDKHTKSTSLKRKINLDLSSKLTKYYFQKKIFF